MVNNDKILNPKTGRMVSKHGKIGKELLKQKNKSPVKMKESTLNKATELALSIAHGRIYDPQTAARMRIAIKNLDKYQHGKRNMTTNKQIVKFLKFREAFLKAHVNYYTKLHKSGNDVYKIFKLAYDNRTLWSEENPIFSENEISFQKNIIQYLIYQLNHGIGTKYSNPRLDDIKDKLAHELNEVISKYNIKIIQNYNVKSNIWKIPRIVRYR